MCFHRSCHFVGVFSFKEIGVERKSGSVSYSLFQLSRVACIEIVVLSSRPTEHFVFAASAAYQLVRLQRTESLCRKFLKFVAVAQLHPETLQNIVLAAIDGGLVDTHRRGHFGFCAFLPKQLLD